MEQIATLINADNYKQVSALVSVLKYKYDPKYIELDKKNKEKMEEMKSTDDYKEKNRKAVLKYYYNNEDYRKRQKEQRKARTEAKKQLKALQATVV